MKAAKIHHQGGIPSRRWLDRGRLETHSHFSICTMLVEVQLDLENDDEFSSLHSQSDDDFEGYSYYNKQPLAGMLLQQFNDAWINNNLGVSRKGGLLTLSSL